MNLLLEVLGIWYTCLIKDIRIWFSKQLFFQFQGISIIVNQVLFKSKCIYLSLIDNLSHSLASYTDTEYKQDRFWKEIKNVELNKSEQT